MADDETQRLREELAEARREAEVLRRRYRELIEFAAHGYLLLDAEGVVQEANRGAAVMLRVEPEALQGKSLYDFLPPEAKRAFMARAEGLRQAEAGKLTWETRFTTWDQTSLPVEVTLATLRDEGGRLAGWRIIMVDITGRQAEEGLRQEGAFLQRVIDTVPSMIFVKNRQGVFVLGNKALGRAYDMAPSAMVGKTDEDFNPKAEEVEHFRRDDLEVMDTRRPKLIPEEPVTHTDGRVHWFSTVKVPLVNEDGTCDLVLGVATEITERKEAEDSLRESEARYRELVQNANSAIIRLDHEGRITFFNEYAQDFFGYRAEEVMGRCVGILLPDRESTGRDLRSLIPDFVRHPERYAHYINENIRQDGSRAWMAWTNRPIYDREGQIVEFLAVGSDITDLMLAEEALRRSREELSRAQAVAHTGSWRMDLRTQEVYWSDETYRIFGIPREAPLTYEAFLATVHPDDRERVDRVWREVPPGESFDMEHRIIVEGRGKWVRERGQAEFGAKGEMVSIFGVSQDITDLKWAEAERERLIDQLQEVIRELEAFAHTISHDLRAPLRTINGFAALLMEAAGPALGDDSLRYLNIIREGAIRMGQLIDDLLLYSRLGRCDLHIATVDMGEVVREVWREMMLSQGHRTVDFRLGDLPRARADRGLIRLVWENLLANALKFTRGVEPAIIEVGAEVRAYEGLYYVRDNGVGFDMNHALRLFSIFHRLHHEDEFEGTGVGLAIVKRIVNRHRGRVWIEGKVGRGATVFFTLPLAE